MLKQSLLSLSMVLGLSILPAKIAQSAVLNGSFETGNFSNWDTTATGQTTVEDLGFGVTPTQGDYQAVLQTCFYDANSQACDDGQSLSDANTLESFLANIESTFNIVPSFSHLAKETGYQPFSYTFTSAGTYTLGFGVVDWIERVGEIHQSIPPC